MLDRLLPSYAHLVERLRAAGAAYFQFDEPLLVTDLDQRATDAYQRAYANLRDAAGDAEVTLATYFGPLGDNTELARRRYRLTSRTSTSFAVGPARRGDGSTARHSGPFARPGRRSEPLALRPRSVGPSRGRRHPSAWGAAVQLAPSCSLLHLPVDLSAETALDAELVSWLAFATERLDEIRILGRVADGDPGSVAAELEANRLAAAACRDTTGASLRRGGAASPAC